MIGKSSCVILSKEPIYIVCRFENCFHSRLTCRGILSWRCSQLYLDGFRQGLSLRRCHRARGWWFRCNVPVALWQLAVFSASSALRKWSIKIVIVYTASICILSKIVLVNDVGGSWTIYKPVDEYKCNSKHLHVNLKGKMYPSHFQVGLRSLPMIYFGPLPLFGAFSLARPLLPFPKHSKVVSSTLDNCACDKKMPGVPRIHAHRCKLGTKRVPNPLYGLGRSCGWR
jgi:hypothetical protein